MKLYGGGIEAAIPEDLLDASTVRPVPDSQEVFTGTIDGKDVSVIVDLCEQVDPHLPLLAAAQTHVEDVHHMASNDQSEPEPLETVTETINGHETVFQLEAVRNSKTGMILLSYALFRLRQHQTDVFLTYMTHIGEEGLPQDMSSYVNRARQALREFVSTFKVCDSRLFDESAQSENP